VVTEQGRAPGVHTSVEEGAILARVEPVEISPHVVWNKNTILAGSDGLELVEGSVG
jgi:hypothetical protein